MNTDLQSAMFTRIEQWQESGQSKHAYCQAQSIPEWKFYYWQRRYREHHSPSGFAPLRIQSQKKVSKAEQTIEIRFSNGTSIIVPPGSQLSTIRYLAGL